MMMTDDKTVITAEPLSGVINENWLWNDPSVRNALVIPTGKRTLASSTIDAPSGQCPVARQEKAVRGIKAQMNRFSNSLTPAILQISRKRFSPAIDLYCSAHGTSTCSRFNFDFDVFYGKATTKEKRGDEIKTNKSREKYPTLEMPNCLI